MAENEPKLIIVKMYRDTHKELKAKFEAKKHGEVKSFQEFMDTVIQLGLDRL